MTADGTPNTLRAVIGAAIGLMFVLALPSVRIMWLNPERYYVYEGTNGPLEAVHAADGSVTAGRPITSVRQGGSFTWVRTICFHDDASVLSIIELRNTTTSQIVSRREFETLPQDQVCGPRTIEVAVPMDAPPGHYSADRHLVIEPRSAPPLSADLPSVEIEVLAK
jgi:hypothetical protein